MALSTFATGNRFLDQDKLSFADDAAYAGDVTSADRLIRAALLEIFGSVVNTWDLPNGTGEVDPPLIVQDISGMLAASYLYRRIYSEETSAIPLYADELEKRALALIDGLRNGSISIGDDTIINGTDLAQGDFWPNDTYVDTCGNPVRLFTIEDRY